MEMGGGEPVHWPGAVVFESGNRPPASLLGCVIAAHACVDVAFHILQGLFHRLAVGLLDPLITADERRDGYRLRGLESSVPRRTVFHGFVSGQPVTDELLTGVRVLPFGEAREVFGVDRSS